MIKRLAISTFFLASSLLADTATLEKVVSENILQVNVNGISKKVHLAGIELFATANNHSKEVSPDTRAELRKQTMEYIKDKLSKTENIKYGVLATDEHGVQTVWLQTDELNYKMIRDGYAVVNVDDPHLAHGFEMRMTMAMKYAQERKLGLWAEESNHMASLVDTGKHMCGWKQTPKHQGVSKEEILKDLVARAYIKQDNIKLVKLDQK